MTKNVFLTFIYILILYMNIYYVCCPLNFFSKYTIDLRGLNFSCKTSATHFFLPYNLCVGCFKIFWFTLNIYNIHTKKAKQSLFQSRMKTVVLRRPT